MFFKELIPTLILLGMLNFSWNGLYSSNVSLVMDIINPDVGASEFSIISSIANVGNVVPSALAGSLLVLIGFQNIFILSSVLVIPSLFILLKFIKEQ
jgi:MFS family permease